MDKDHSEEIVEVAESESALALEIKKQKPIKKKDRKRLYKEEKLRKEKEFFSNPPKGALTEGTASTCSICNENFPSKTKLFKHLESAHGYCNGLPKLNKYIILLGFIPIIETDNINWQISEWTCMNDSIDNNNDDNQNKGDMNTNLNSSVGPMINGTRTVYDETTLRVDATLIAAMNLLETIESTDDTTSALTVLSKNDVDKHRSFDLRPKGYMRGSLSSQRSTNVFGVEDSMSALCDVVSFQVTRSKHNDNEWITKINQLLKPHKMRVLGRVILEGLAATEFNAENACSQRVYEMLVPLQIMLDSVIDQRCSDEPTMKKKRVIMLTHG